MLYKLLFVLYTESKNLIPLASKYGVLSLRKLLHDLFIGQVHYSKDGYELSTHLSLLNELFKVGDRRMPAKFGGEHFEHENKIRIKNHFIKQALFKLTVFEFDGSEHKFLDFSSLNVELIGNIYEGTLSLEYVVKDRSVSARKIGKKTGAVVHSTGTTYTPPSVVKYVVEQTLPAEIRKIPLICDPACGSGHFLVQSLRHLSRSVGFETTKAINVGEHLHKLAKKSIFGVDKNPMSTGVASARSKRA